MSACSARPAHGGELIFEFTGLVKSQMNNSLFLSNKNKSKIHMNNEGTDNSIAKKETSLIDALRQNNTIFVKKISELTADSETIVNKMRDEEPKPEYVEQDVGPIEQSKTVKIDNVSEAEENIVSDDGLGTDDAGDEMEIVLGIQSNSSIDESMTSAKLYDKSQGKSIAMEVLGQPIPFDRENKHKCPLPKCWKTFKKVSQVKGHVAFHFFKLVSKNFPFKKDQQCSLCVTKTVLKTPSGHVYHYGVTHKQLINLIPDSDENKQYAMQFLK